MGPISINNLGQIFVSLEGGDTFELIGNITEEQYEYRVPEEIDISDIKCPINFGVFKMNGTSTGGFAYGDERFDTDGISGFLNGIEVVRD